MPFIARFYSFLIIGLVLTGCSVRDARFSPKAIVMNSHVLPPDVATPSKGIFALPGSADPAEMCCWIAPDTLLHVRKSVKNARTLTIGFYVPENKNGRVNQRLRIGLVGSAFSRFVLLDAPGYQVVHLRLPRTLAYGTGVRVISIKSSDWFKPGGVNGPRYSVLLSSIYFE